MRSGNYNAPWRRKKRTLSTLRVGIISVVLSGCVAAALYASRSGLSVARIPEASRLETPAMDLADEDTRRALRWLRSPRTFYRGQWLGDACIDGGTDAPEVYVMTRHRMSSHGPVDDVRVTLRIDSGGEAVHEIHDGTSRSAQSRRHARVFDQSEAKALRKMLVAGGYPGSVNETESRSCLMEFTTMQSCVEGRYYGRATTCGESEPASLSGLADAIESFALGPHEAARQ